MASNLDRYLDFHNILVFWKVAIEWYRNEIRYPIHHQSLHRLFHLWQKSESAFAMFLSQMHPKDKSLCMFIPPEFMLRVFTIHVIMLKG